MNSVVWYSMSCLDPGSSTDALRRIHYHNIFELPELLDFIRSLPRILKDNEAGAFSAHLGVDLTDLG